MPVARLVALSLVGWPLVACSVLTPPDARLCSAAQSLSAAMTLTATAIAADDAGDLARAQGLATQARSLSELASDTLQQIPSGQQGDAVWQALSASSTQAGQAANSLLPAYAGTHGLGAEFLANATASMNKAHAGLPEMCFAIPADLETPGSS
jgi:hypothetical protein